MFRSASEPRGMTVTGDETPIIHHEVGQHPWYETYRLVTGFIQPRPIALVSTLDADGHPNLAPFSFYNCVSANPLMVAFSPLLKGHSAERKDTLDNVLATKEFVIATVTETMAEAMNEAAKETPDGDSEWDDTGFTPRPSDLVAPPAVTESPVNMECRLHDVLHFGAGGGAGNLVIGAVLRIHIDQRIMDMDGRIDPDALATIGRMGNADYTRSREGLFQLDRPA